MRIIIIADLHLGRSHRLVPNLTELTLKAFRQVMGMEWDALLIAGDVFDSGTPHPSLIASFMNELKGADRPILINYGNHDATRKGSATDPLRYVASDCVQLVSGGGVYPIGPIKVTSENWPMRMHKGQNRVVYPEGEPDCVMLHGSSKGHPNTPRDDWTYQVYTDKPVFLGHLHAPSIHELGNYPGTLVPGNFNETHQAGGLVWDGETIERFTLDGFPTFRTIEDSLASTTHPKEGENVRVVAKSGRNLKLEKAVKERFSSAVVDYKPPENTIRAEASAISEAKTMMEMYRAYLEGMKRDTSILSTAREFLNA